MPMQVQEQELARIIQSHANKLNSNNKETTLNVFIGEVHINNSVNVDNSMRTRNTQNNVRSSVDLSHLPPHRSTRRNPENFKVTQPLVEYEEEQPKSFLGSFLNLLGKK